VEAGPVEFEDGVHGPQAFDVSTTVGDFVVARSDGIPAYQLAVAVDDAAMGITEVVRGDDLLASTARQLLVYRALGLPPPRFAHVPLVVGPDGQRLAKRHGALSLGELRLRGADPRGVAGLLASISGLAPAGTKLHPRDLVEGFRLEHVARSPARLEPEAAELLLASPPAGAGG
jgi:glutamyl-tRNA synthetase